MSSPNSSSSTSMPLMPSTKEAMIVSAERQFALNGIEGVSLRQIAIDANQRNESVVHYHFGSREGLIRAILAYRITKVNARRAKWLTGGSRNKGLGVGRLVASALIYPLAEEIFKDWRSCYWVRFLTQLYSVEMFRYIAEEFEATSTPFSQTFDMVKSVPDVDATILNVRQEILRRDVVWGLARVEAMSFEESRDVCELHVANLVDMIAAAISVTPSAETLLKANVLSKHGQLGGSRQWGHAART